MIDQFMAAWAALVGIWDGFMSLLAMWPYFAACALIGLIIGAWIGWRGVLAVLTLGVGLLAIKALSKDEPDWIDGGDKPVKRTRRTAKRSPDPAKSLSSSN